MDPICFLLTFSLSITGVGVVILLCRNNAPNVVVINNIQEPLHNVVQQPHSPVTPPLATPRPKPRPKATPIRPVPRSESPNTNCRPAPGFLQELKTRHTQMDLSKHETFESWNNKMECPICLDSIVIGVDTCPHCGNHYHAECLHQWTKKQNNCPNCRQAFRAKTFVESIRSFFWRLFLRFCKWYIYIIHLTTQRTHYLSTLTISVHSRFDIYVWVPTAMVIHMTTRCFMDFWWKTVGITIVYIADTYARWLRYTFNTNRARHKGSFKFLEYTKKNNLHKKWLTMLTKHKMM